MVVRVHPYDRAYEKSVDEVLMGISAALPLFWVERRCLRVECLDQFVVCVLGPAHPVDRPVVCHSFIVPSGTDTWFVVGSGSHTNGEAIVGLAFGAMFRRKCTCRHWFSARFQHSASSTASLWGSALRWLRLGKLVIVGESLTFTLQALQGLKTSCSATLLGAACALRGSVAL